VRRFTGLVNKVEMDCSSLNSQAHQPRRVYQANIWDYQQC